MIPLQRKSSTLEIWVQAQASMHLWRELGEPTANMNKNKKKKPLWYSRQGSLRELVAGEGEYNDDQRYSLWRRSYIISSVS